MIALLLLLSLVQLFRYVVRHMWLKHSSWGYRQLCLQGSAHEELGWGRLQLRYRGASLVEERQLRVSSIMKCLSEQLLYGLYVPLCEAIRFWIPRACGCNGESHSLAKA